MALSLLACESATYDRASVSGTWDDGKTLGSVSRWVLTADGKGAEYAAERKPGETETKWPTTPSAEFTWEVDEAAHQFTRTLVARDGKPLPKPGELGFSTIGREPVTYEYEFRASGKRLNLKRNGSYSYNWRRTVGP